MSTNNRNQEGSNQDQLAVNQVNQMGLGLSPMLKLEFSQMETNTMKEIILNLFNLIKNENGKVDITELKAYLYHENVHNLSPTMFKRVNDLAKSTKFEGQWTQQEFLRFFMAQDLISSQKPPSLYDFVLLFETLDEDRTGMISAQNLRSFLETAERLKQANFDSKKYEDNIMDQEIKDKYDNVESDLQDLVAEFDLTGDRLISPEEFYNIIMASYE